MNLSSEILELIANRFKVLAEPSRLEILHFLGPEEKSVGEIAIYRGNSAEYFKAFEIVAESWNFSAAAGEKQRFLPRGGCEYFFDVRYGL